MERSYDRWQALCREVEIPDALPTWEAGAWTQDKLYFWKRYIDITTQAMTDHPKFPGGLIYVDLFGGAGICTLKETKRRFPGSTLIAASASKPFSKIIVCENDAVFANACRTRLSKTAVANSCLVLDGDCNLLIDKVLTEIPRRSLTLAFIDPKALDIKFDTVSKLSQVRADLVILFADAYDIHRNDEKYYRSNPNSKLDEVLGPDSEWRARLDLLPSHNSTDKRKLYAEIYQDQLKKHLGYTHFDEQVMSRAPGPLACPTPLYRLIYASKNKLGLKFWREAKKEDAGGQRGFDF
jgi:three-Cys-motif partner protein